MGLRRLPQNAVKTAVHTPNRSEQVLKCQLKKNDGRNISTRFFPTLKAHLRTLFSPGLQLIDPPNQLRNVRRKLKNIWKVSIFFWKFLLKVEIKTKPAAKKAQKLTVEAVFKFWRRRDVRSQRQWQTVNLHHTRKLEARVGMTQPSRACTRS